MAPGAEMRKLGFEPVGVKRYQLADGTICEFPFALAEITFLGETTAGRLIFGPDDVEPLLGVTVLESAGIVLDPVTGELRRLPAISLR
jgi:predicted aspartyl protease